MGNFFPSNLLKNNTIYLDRLSSLRARVVVVAEINILLADGLRQRWLHRHWPAKALARIPAGRRTGIEPRQAFQARRFDLTGRRFPH